MTQKQKAKAYDEALKVANKYKDTHIMFPLIQDEIFPELRESEDEKIRKELIEFVKSRGGFKQEYIAWLEKQAAQNPVDKSEPKFKQGDWIVFNGLVLRVGGVSGGFYVTTSKDGITNGYDWDIDNAARLWTIQDVKDGDILIDKSNSRECPFIFKETKPSDVKTDVLNPLAVLGYCGIGGAGFTKGSGWGDTANCTYYPANKEQQNLLFQKMKEAGYEWDAEKKELNKVEQKDVIQLST